MIFNKWYQFLAKGPDWLFYPLVFCEKCVCGQLALWLYPLVIIQLMGLAYNPFLHIFFIMQSILNVVILKAIYEAKIERVITPKMPEVPLPKDLQLLTKKENAKS